MTKELDEQEFERFMSEFTKYASDHGITFRLIAHLPSQDNSVAVVKGIGHTHLGLGLVCKEMMGVLITDLLKDQERIIPVNPSPQEPEPSH